MAEGVLPQPTLQNLGHEVSGFPATSDIPLAEELRFLAAQCRVRLRHPDRSPDPAFLAGLILCLDQLAGPQAEAPSHPSPSFVMPALVAGIHDFAPHDRQVVDGRDKPGHDERRP